MKKINPITAILFLILLVTLLGLFLDIMQPDAALYASIAKSIHLNNDFVNLYALEKDWLDKPHLPFWLTAISFKIFGISNFAYKIPGVLIFFFGAWVTFKFTKEAYNKETAIIASLILLTSLHSVISNFDVRAEPYLTGFIIAGFYWFYKYSKYQKWKDLLLASFFCGLAVMTKGIFALTLIFFALVGNFIIKRKIKKLIDYKWIVAGVLIAIFILPEIYVLYKQFDVHPEKVVFGKRNVSGIKFFLWDSQFGRFFNTGPITGKGDFFFFLHTLLWAFLPWSLLFYIATFLKVKRNLKKVKRKEEFYTISGTLGTILIFSLSKFQLAHYTNIIFPFMAIIVADFIVKLKNKYYNLQNLYFLSQRFLIILVLIITLVISYISLSDFVIWFLPFSLFCIYLIWIINKKEKNGVLRIFYLTLITFCFFYGFMFSHFYPTILKYQGGVYAARFVNEKTDINRINILDNNNYYYGFQYYCDKPIKRIEDNTLSSIKGELLYSDTDDLERIKKMGLTYTILKEFDFFRITKINAKFLNKITRKETLDKRFIIQLN